MEFQIVEKRKSEDLEHEITLLLRDHWTFHGILFTRMIDDDSYIGQAMIRGNKY